MKIGIIRCSETEDMCPGTTCFKMASMGRGAFEDTGPVEVVGFVTCGGCPGKRAVARAQTMAQRSVDAIVLASCMKRGTPIGYPCPHIDSIEGAIREKLPETRIIDWTH